MPFATAAAGWRVAGGEAAFRLESAAWGGTPDLRRLTIVGVVGDVRVSPAGEPMPSVYVACAQWPVRYMRIAIRAAAPAALAESARKVVHSMNGNIVVRPFVLADRVRDDPGMSSRRFAVGLLGTLAAVAAAMALLGIYGLLAYAVAQRTAEIGIRLALGATRGGIVRGVVGQGLVMAGVGLAVGAACAIGTVRAVRAILVVDPADPATVAGVGAMVIAVALAASVLPARRATMVEPIRALRRE